MKKFYFVLVAVLFTAYACERMDFASDNEVDDNPENIVDGGKISLKKAMSNADFVYANIGDADSRVRKIQSVEVLTSSDLNGELVCTRYSSAMGETESDEPLAYVVNYEDNAGYAILAANEDLPPIIGLGDNGNFSAAEFVNYTQNGIEDLSPAKEMQYAVINNSLRLPSVNIGGVGYISVDTTLVLKCMPLVPTKWHQSEPYNYYAPIDDNNEKCVAGCVPVAGAQAFASLCYHHNWRPTTQLSQEYLVDWYTINRIIYNDEFEYNANDYSDNALAVASLIRAVGEDVDADYGGNETSAYTPSLVNTCNRLGMSSASFVNLNNNANEITGNLFDMIVENNYPVVTKARRDKGDGTTVGHAFVLDGWLRLQYSQLYFSTSENAPPQVVGDRFDNRQLIIDLVHTNFGWGGLCDGYYLPDAFDLTKQKYSEYAEENDMPATMDRVYDLNIGYLLYEL